MKNSSSSFSYTIFIALVVSLGGFLFGFDAAIISSVIGSVEVLFDLNDIQTGWVVSSPSFSAMFAMLIAGYFSNIFGRKKVLIAVAFLYALSAIMSAYANSYEMLYIARMIGGAAFGSALVIAPMYIAEISNPQNRGKLVSIQQLNIVLGFSAAYFAGYFISKMGSGAEGTINENNAWRWMLGIEAIPAILYFFLLFFIPRSPRWLILKNQTAEAETTLKKLHGEENAIAEIQNIQKSLSEQDGQKASFSDLFSSALRTVIIVGLVVGILQQITGINAIFFYSTTIFEQTGIGTDGALVQNIILGIVNVLFTLLAMYLIDRMGRRPLLLIGTAGIAISMLITSYGFHQATYQLDGEKIAAMRKVDTEKLASLKNTQFETADQFSAALKTTLGTADFEKFGNDVLAAAKNTEGGFYQLTDLRVNRLRGVNTDNLTKYLADKVFDNDLDFNAALKQAIPNNQEFKKFQPGILKAAANINPFLVLIGILGFVASFAFSLGPVMWVMLSELFPNWIRALAIGAIGFINSATSWLVQQIFPWELSNFGNALTFLIYAAFAVVGFIIMRRMLPETKGKSLEEIERDLVGK